MCRRHNRPGSPAAAGHNQSENRTGEIEVAATDLEVLNMAEVLPFPVDDPEVSSKVNEELRLQYRYLDLRRPEMARNLRLRSRSPRPPACSWKRQGFLEVETPILFKSTPEGAANSCSESPRTGNVLRVCRSRRNNSNKSDGCRRRTVIISWPVVFAMRPARRSPARIYSDRPRDAFTERDDIYLLIEGCCGGSEGSIGVDIVTPFTKMSFAEALNRYGSDKPDARFGMELADFTGNFGAARSKCSAARSRAGAW